MAISALKNLFRFIVTTLNFLSPSIFTDIVFHPLDFVTVLLQIGYDPQASKYESATLMSVIVQYALLTFYIPHLMTSMQSLHFAGIFNPKVAQCLNHIYRTEGVLGCYRGFLPKLCERFIMLSVSEKIKGKINRASIDSDDLISDNDVFIQNLVDSVCYQFFAVLASHPFHVLMVSSFAEFAYGKRSSLLTLSHSIYTDDGYLGFFTGLTARLIGEILSLMFSLTYNRIIDRQKGLQVMEVPTQGHGHGHRGFDIHMRASEIHTRITEIHPRVSEVHLRAPEVHPRAPEVHPRAPEVHPRAPEVHPRASEVHLRVADLHPRASEVHPRASEVHPRASELHPRASELHPRASELHPRASELHPRASELHPRASELHPRASELHPRASDLHPRALELQSRGSDLHSRVLDPNAKTADSHAKAVDSHTKPTEGHQRQGLARARQSPTHPRSPELAKASQNKDLSRAGGSKPKEQQHPIVKDEPSISNTDTKIHKETKHQVLTQETRSTFPHIDTGIASSLHQFLPNALHFFNRYSPSVRRIRVRILRNHRSTVLGSYITFLTGKLYRVVFRDMLSKKISGPFLLVCHCAIVLHTGWDRFPLLTYIYPLVDLFKIKLVPVRSRFLKRKSPVALCSNS